MCGTSDERLLCKEGVNGMIIPQTPIAVDHWKMTPMSPARVFFLSHMHEDHMKGLTPTWRHKIHCSPLTKRLLIDKFQFDPSQVVELEPGEDHLVSVTDSETSSFRMTVSVIDAAHCPGSVMFIFQGYFGKIFYTGDFRFSSEIMDNLPANYTTDVDVLYLDNTFCSPNCVFPTRAAATEEIIKAIEQSSDAAKILIGVRNLGKETLLMEIAKRFQCWIQVTERRLEMINLLNLPNYFQTGSESRIEAVPMDQIKSSYMKNHPEMMAILPTALYIEHPHAFTACKNISLVPYSDHSSYAELHEFVAMVRPRKVVPIVGEKSRGVFGGSVCHRADMSCFDRYCDKSPGVQIEIPDNVRNVMKRGLDHSSRLNRFKFKRNLQQMNPRRQRPKKMVFDAATPEKNQSDCTVAIATPASPSSKLNCSVIVDRCWVHQKCRLNAPKTKLTKYSVIKSNKFIRQTPIPQTEL
ncbi:hypothetical protein CAPTEDRAFT_225584 [Capitella teleta]|uniref:5' exonuclease Apollo n=1 Tax=Capitella teleta TaxID=283909 RepID=R7TWQ0_CAPTE|nr:hypothetical protein CAPTEDRAFT_225584 [Capitella teleta]|eukprot:ELT95851.1 hypothetical protein CAPTEDRAFT_225584 [Capitella teleta]